MAKRAQVVPWVPFGASVVRIHSHPTILMDVYISVDSQTTLKGHESIVSDMDRLVESVDLIDILDFIKSLNSDSWVPSCYWKNIGKDINTPILSGINWSIYSYLVSRGLLVIEDTYYGRYSHIKEKYKTRDSYDNKYEKFLYNPILCRMVSSGYLDVVNLKVESGRFFDHYQIGKSFLRREKLDSLGI